MIRQRALLFSNLFAFPAPMRNEQKDLAQKKSSWIKSNLLDVF